MNIDWSKAPEGATHWFAPYFYKVGSSGVMFDLDDQWHKSSYSKDELFTRESCISKPALWAGTGLPPVGTILETCAYHIQKGEWTEVEILAHAKHDEDDALLVCEIDHDGDRADMHGIIYRSHYFRPIRTQEQIEAEERSQAICEMIRVWNVPPNGSEFNFAHDRAEMLYDAGYRRQPQPKEDA